MKIKIYNNNPNIEVTNHYLDTIRKGIIESKKFECEFIFDFNKLNPNDYILVSTPIDAFKLYLKGYKNILLWMQGIPPEESYMRNKSKIRSKILSYIDKFVLKKSKFTFLVSEEMKKFLENKYQIKLQYIYIMPCYNDKLNLDLIYSVDKYNKNTFAYLGGLSKWQCFEQTLKLYKSIEEKFEDAKLLVLTKNIVEATNLLKKYKISNYEIDCVKPEDVSKRLADIKYGFVIRANDPVNHVSTPTKISNYLSAGVIPIITKEVKDFVSLYGQNKSVCVLNSPEDTNNLLDYIKNEINPLDIKQEISKIYNSYYNDTYHIQNIAKLFSTLVLN